MKIMNLRGNTGSGDLNQFEGCYLIFSYPPVPSFGGKSESKRKPPDPKYLENQRPPGSKRLGKLKTLRWFPVL